MKEYSAGGVVYRQTDGQIEVLLIHDRFNKMTLPKGHLEEGETEKQAALREVREETGIEAQIIGDPLGVISFQFDVPGRGSVTKEVTYYLMEAVSGETKAQIEEIRDVFWFPLEHVLTIHSERGYDNNNIILERAVKRLKGDKA
ncbi:NUDIX hydrolase [Effusibacillus lacus]|uniref:NTP pyrophosphohydrolase n=1 Tax=Effusibacillus lacus TaxID=1348429 RepID=A0A292YNM7_9BACL|nr:NUDIX hydrolase [Effusibacillus lacus]TCS70397.1 diadenosine hexaphosphate hydrolase (ATP-forming) [Effusibacillus lacus]GAX91548.1 NTP pyrophosphohydrolase [Effusibacillus lacus]